MTTEPNNSAEQEPTVRMAAYDHLAELHRKIEAENTRLKTELERAKEEIEVLRSYGNKDCTSMADARLWELREQSTQNPS